MLKMVCLDLAFRWIFIDLRNKWKHDKMRRFARTLGAMENQTDLINNEQNIYDESKQKHSSMYRVLTVWAYFEVLVLTIILFCKKILNVCDTYPENFLDIGHVCISDGSCKADVIVNIIVIKLIAILSLIIGCRTVSEFLFQSLTTALIYKIKGSKIDTFRGKSTC